MKRLLWCSLLSLFALAAVWAEGLDKPLAVVRLTKTEQIGSVFFNKQLEVLQKQLGMSLDAAKKKQLLESRIDTILIAQAADRDKVILSDSDVMAMLNQQKASVGDISDEAFHKMVTQQTGFTWDEYVSSARDGLIQQKYLLAKRPQLASGKFNVSESEVTDTYDAQVSKFVSPAMVRFDYINIDTRGKDAAAKAAIRQKIDEVAKAIKGNGAAFDEQKKKLLDNTAFNVGDSNYIMKNEAKTQAYFGKNFLETAFGMAEGAVSAVLDTQYGYFIIKVTDKRNPKLIGIDDPLYPGQKLTPREQIRQALVNQKQTEAVTKAMDEIIKELRKQADISYFEKNFGW